MNSVLERIKSRGHWVVVIRPTRFVEKRIPEITKLKGILEKSSVQLRGWDFPHIDPHVQTRINLDWIGQESAWEHHLELWRFYQSGQFFDISGMMEDWRDVSSLWSASSDWRPGSVLSLVNTVFRFTEIFEFAARVSLTEAGDENMMIEVRLKGLEGRSLWLDDPWQRSLFQQYRASLDEFPYTVEIERTDLVAAPRSFALKASMESLARFGLEISPETLRGMQEELRR